MEAFTYPRDSRYIGAWQADLSALRPQANWQLYWALLHEPELYLDIPRLRTEADLRPRYLRRARASLIDKGLLADDGQIIGVPASCHLHADMSSTERRLELAWALYGPQSRKERSETTGIDYGSKALSGTPYGPAPDRDFAVEWIGRTCQRPRQWARNRIADAGTATILAWQPVWHIVRRDLRKGTAWLVKVWRNRNLPHLRNGALVEWQFEAVQLPLFEHALPVVRADKNLTQGGQKPNGGADKNLTQGGQKPNGFTAPVKGNVNRPRVKDGEMGESAARRPSPREGHPSAPASNGYVSGESRFLRSALINMAPEDRIRHLGTLGLDEQLATRKLIEWGLDS